MADKQITELPAASGVTDDTLIPVYVPGSSDPAQRLTGAQFKAFAEASVSEYVGAAQAAANEATEAAGNIGTAVEDTQANAESAQTAAASAAAAQASAESAATTAAAAQTEAAAASANAIASAAEASQSAAGASDAKVAAETAREASETAKTAAEGASTSAAEKAAEAAASADTAAQDAQAAAEARAAIENMLVEAVSLASGQPATVSKELVDGVVKLVFGLPAGKQGDPGASIQSITRTAGTGAPGTTDTYTITLTDGSTTTFQVYNGKDGEGAGDMTAIVYDPQGKKTDVYGYADDAAAAAEAAANSYTDQKIAAIPAPEETDPTVPEWAKQPTKPTYTASEVGALPDTTSIPTALSDLSDDAAHRVVTDEEKTAWSAKQDAITGTQGQVVGFGADGKPVAQDASKAEIFSVSLPAAGWSNNAQTVSHAMLKAAGYGYIYNPDEASYGAYVSALVRCGEVTVDGQVTFSCEETPTDDITVNFMRSEANENV